MRTVRVPRTPPSQRLCVWLALASLAANGRAETTEFLSADGETPFRQGWRDAVVSATPAEKLGRLPAFKSRKPLFLAFHLGNGKDAVITAALDESRGTDMGYDRLIVDANNNNDLRDDVVLVPAVREAGSSIVFEVEPVDVAVMYADGTSRLLGVKPEIRAYRHPGSGELSFSAAYRLSRHMTGILDFGRHGRKLAAIYDAKGETTSPNGCFNDAGTDRFRLDLDGDGQLDEAKEDFPLSRVIALDGELWEFETDAAAQRVRVRPFAGKTGTARLAVKVEDDATIREGRVEFSNDAGVHIVCRLPSERSVALPVGDYRLNRGRLAVSMADDAMWTASFSMSEPLTIREDGETTVTLGMPLKVGPAIQSSPRRGETVCVKPRVLGAAGERYEDLAPAQTRMMPAVTITDAEAIVVAQANMDYG